MFTHFLAFPCFHMRLLSFFLKNHISPSFLKINVSLGLEFCIGSDVPTPNPATLAFKRCHLIILVSLTAWWLLRFSLCFWFSDFYFDRPRLDFHYIYFAWFSQNSFSLQINVYLFENSQLLFLPYSLFSFWGGVGNNVLIYSCYLANYHKLSVFK